MSPGILCITDWGELFMLSSLSTQAISRQTLGVHRKLNNSHCKQLAGAGLPIEGFRFK